MHEMSIVHNLISIVKEEMVKNNAARLRSVRVNIGEMSGIVPEALRTCFDIVTAKGDMKGALLKIDTLPLVGYCRKCKKDFNVIDYKFLCPECDSTDIDIISGREMNVVEIEVE
ncbi:hydrogenase maturation nickel metallochaperone HypA [Thermodesulfobacteriota bacterium]